MGCKQPKMKLTTPEHASGGLPRQAALFGQIMMSIQHATSSPILDIWEVSTPFARGSGSSSACPSLLAALSPCGRGALEGSAGPLTALGCPLAVRGDACGVGCLLIALACGQMTLLLTQKYDILLRELAAAGVC